MKIEKNKSKQKEIYLQKFSISLLLYQSHFLALYIITTFSLFLFASFSKIFFHPQRAKKHVCL